MNQAAFLTAYESMLRMYATFPVYPYLQQVKDSIAGKPPHYELAGSPIAQATWRNLWQEGEVTTDKVASLPV